MKKKDEKKKILIIDFGSQVTGLIARRVREFGVYSEVIKPNDLHLSLIHISEPTRPY